MGLTVLIPGAGARENAWAWKLAQSPRVGKIYCAPGTPGTAQFAENVQIPPTSIDRLARFAERRSIDLTVVGREDLLGLGIVNTFRARGLRIFGPTRAAAEIETDKALAKFMMSVSGIPTGTFRVFSRYDEAVVYVVECFTHTPGLTLFIKASGLASGKGAYRCETLEKAQEALWKIMVGRVHQDAGDNVLVEECIPGQEISIHALADGKSSILFPPAQDHKTIGEDERSPMTGGMGVITPVPWFKAHDMAAVDRQIVLPTLSMLASSGRRFSGCLFPGLKITNEGPKVLEFNARFGDPETQAYMRLLKSDLVELLWACTDGTLATCKLGWRGGFAASITFASGWYPY